MTLPLEGIKILDFSNLLPGPFCTMTLADFGAEIIKVERPHTGDFTRRNKRMFNAVNRNKKSITVDLKDEQEIEFIKQMIKECDVLVEGFRPGVMARLGLDYQEVSKINNQIIYCSISGFGQTGPLRTVPGHDVNYLALSGALSISGDPAGPPAPWGGVQVADLTSAMYAVTSILAALRNRDLNGQGDFIDVSITDTVLAWMGPRIASYYDQGKPNKENFLTTGAYGAFETKDHEYIALGSLEDHFFENLCHSIGRTELLNEEKYKTWPLRSQNAKTLNPIIEEELLKKPLAEWLEIFDKNDVPSCKVNEIGELPQVESFIERDLFENYGTGEGEYFVKYPVKFENLSVQSPKEAAKLGENNSEYSKNLKGVKNT
ncbi:CaiB/BaiF CoA transferase family protein [Bacillus dakarensis]|uniref:CaiB/BaiF CoA transferase family protein n=1 Tax=Robertmurraya dakarensis TaxID=1926278 RepID=UPI000981D30A|nr:CaiB/BaiF CoA-transferase family protein [Bacillus dakarensis]